eukprot:scaffold718_cov342-Pavlova_lutheri.AAC.42
MTSEEKVQIALQLHALGVDVIEAGFPIASPDDFAAVKRIAVEVGNIVDEDGYVPVICGLSRARKPDIERAWDAVKFAKRPRVHTFIATSEIHMKDKLRMTPDQVVATAVECVSFAKSLGCTDIEFSPEDAGRSEPAFLYRILEAVIKAGATTLNIPDTTGWCMPPEFGKLIADIRTNTPGAEDVILSVHCQNDLGLSTANSLAGVHAGARQVECTINGIGERAGNASLEEVVMSLYLRGESHFGGLYTGIRPVHIAHGSKMVEEFSGLLVQPHKAIVGKNAFLHESGIHQDGMLKSSNTYEIMSPETIGLTRESEAGIRLGKLSGRNALAAKLEELGFKLDQNELQAIFNRFKILAEKKKEVTEEDLLALIGDEMSSPRTIWEVLDVQVVCGTMGMPTATIKMRGPDGMIRLQSAIGTGPVDAAYKAVDMIVCVPNQLVDYNISSVTDGIDALATTRVSIRPKENGTLENAQGRRAQRNFGGNGADSDIVVASVRAYVSALNKLITYLRVQQETAEELALESESGSMESVGR